MYYTCMVSNFNIFTLTNVFYVHAIVIDEVQIPAKNVDRQINEKL